MEIYWMIGFLLVVFILYAWFSTRGEVYTGRVMVVSRRVEAGTGYGGGRWRSSNWNYLAIFQFSDGQQMELYVSESQYDQLKENSTGQIVWYNDVLSEFIPDMEVYV